MVKLKMFQKNLILVVTLLSLLVSRGSLAASGLIGSVRAGPAAADKDL
jgi:hypothetical protein